MNNNNKLDGTKVSPFHHLFRTPVFASQSPLKLMKQILPKLGIAICYNRDSVESALRVHYGPSLGDFVDYKIDYNTNISLVEYQQFTRN